MEGWGGDNLQVRGADLGAGRVITMNVCRSGWATECIQNPENETAANLRDAARCGPLTGAERGLDMPRKGHSEEQIVYAIRQVESRQEGDRICREMGVLAQAFYSWKRRYAGVGISELRELRAITRREPKTQKLSGRPNAPQAYSAGSAVKKSLKPAARRQLVEKVRQTRQLTESRACGLIGIARWSNRYRSRKDPQTALCLRLPRVGR